MSAVKKKTTAAAKANATQQRRERRAPTNSTADSITSILTLRKAVLGTDERASQIASTLIDEIGVDLLARNDPNDTAVNVDTLQTLIDGATFTMSRQSDEIYTRRESIFEDSTGVKTGSGISYVPRSSVVSTPTVTPDTLERRIGARIPNGVTPVPAPPTPALNPPSLGMRPLTGHHAVVPSIHLLNGNESMAGLGLGPVETASPMGITPVTTPGADGSIDTPTFGGDPLPPMLPSQYAILARDEMWPNVATRHGESMRHIKETGIGTMERLEISAKRLTTPANATPTSSGSLSEEVAAEIGDMWAATAAADMHDAAALRIPSSQRTQRILQHMVEEDATRAREENIFHDVLFDEDSKAQLRMAMPEMRGDGLLAPHLASYRQGGNDAPLPPRVANASRVDEELVRRLEQRTIEGGHIFSQLMAQEMRDHENGVGYAQRNMNTGTAPHQEHPDIPIETFTTLLEWMREPSLQSVHPETGHLRYCTRGDKCLGLYLTRVHHGIATTSQPPAYPTAHGFTPIASPHNAQRANVTASSDLGFKLAGYLRPRERDACLRGTMRPPERPCVLCHMHEVTEHFHRMELNAHGTIMPVNMFCVVRDRPDGFRGDVCLQYGSPWQKTGAPVTSGDFPAFQANHFEYSIYTAPDGTMARCIILVGMDFRPSSVV